jgi:hypothetical protein
MRLIRATPLDEGTELTVHEAYGGTLWRDLRAASSEAALGPGLARLAQPAAGAVAAGDGLDPGNVARGDRHRPAVGRGRVQRVESSRGVRITADPGLVAAARADARLGARAASPAAGLPPGDHHDGYHQEE